MQDIALFLANHVLNIKTFEKNVQMFYLETINIILKGIYK